MPRMLENILEAVPLKSRNIKSRTTQEPSNPNMAGAFQSPLSLQAMPPCVSITLSAIGNDMPAVTTSLLGHFPGTHDFGIPCFKYPKFTPKNV